MGASSLNDYKPPSELEDKLNADEVAEFYGNLDDALDEQYDRFGIEEIPTLVGVGGASGMMYNTDQEERPSNDLDFIVIHPDHINSGSSHREANAITGALESLGFEFTAGPDNRRYDQTTPDCQTLENKYPENNSLPVDNIDLIGSEKPLETYPIEWVEEYSEQATSNLAVLGLEGITARKIYRHHVDSRGQEDVDQLYDIIYIRENLDDEEFDVDRFNSAWEELAEANEPEAPLSEAREILMGR